jgi:NADPH:quinone reductase-like Zn-dependent oxidoreductase
MRVWTTSGEGVDSLQLGRAPVPRPGAREVLVRMRAYALNYRDLLVVNGVDGWRPPAPVTPISDGIGDVVALGDGVTALAVGDRVSAAFLPKWTDGRLTRETYVLPVGGPVNRGMLSDYIVLDEREAVRTPAHLTAAEAATLPAAGLTAWHAVARRSRVRAGDTVLVHGTGGVALFALQFATALGARVAITSSSDEKLARAVEVGAAYAINYRTDNVAEKALAWTGGAGVDHIVETVGGDNLNSSLDAVRIGGTIAFIGLIAGRSGEVDTYRFVTKNVTIHGIETGSHDMYGEMARFIDQHRIHPVIDSMFAFEDVQKALGHLAAGAHFGKIVLADR